MIFSKKDVLGVDLGTRTLKGVTLKREKNGRVALVNHFFHDLAQTSHQFPVCNRAEAFKAAVETQGLANSEVAGAVKDSDVLNFTFNLPPMKTKELAQLIPQEIIEQAHIAMDEHSLDFVVSPDPHNSEATTVRAYCVKRDLIQTQVNTLKEAGLKANSIESEMMAITAMLDFNGYIDPKEVSVVFDLGETHLVSGLISEGQLCLTKTDETSFGTVNRILQEQFSLSYDEAEKIKLDFDFMAGPSGEPSKVTETVENIFTEVFKSIKLALEFYKECPESSTRVDKVFLLGGGSQIKSVAEILQVFFKVEAQIVNPFRNIDIFSRFDEASSREIAALAPFMGTAVGLALNSVPGKDAA